MVTSRKENGSLRLKLNHTPQDAKEPVVEFDLDFWSYNYPALLVRHTTTNVSSQLIEDLKVYSIFDFDIGGPTSYKDDMGLYDEENNIIMAYDETGLAVAMSTRPKPDGWEISYPLRLKIEEASRDLKKNFEAGPKDIAIALQSNISDLSPGESGSVEIIIASAQNLDEARSLIGKSWGLFKKKIR
ncbi:MAG: hypothetical protein ACFFD6_02275 [Candidatus Thorarchaeota archaeon]